MQKPPPGLPALYPYTCATLNVQTAKKEIKKAILMHNERPWQHDVHNQRPTIGKPAEGTNVQTLAPLL